MGLGIRADDNDDEYDDEPRWFDLSFVFVFGFVLFVKTFLNLLLAVPYPHPPLWFLFWPISFAFVACWKVWIWMSQ